MRRPLMIAIGVLVLVGSPTGLRSWSNGPAGNATTNEASECASPSYATHDWIADHARDLLPPAEQAWLTPHRTMYLLGTEAPDSRNIPAACGAPHTGYDDRIRGHSVDWNAAHTEMTETRAARRAQEEYSKAVIAFEEGDPSAAAFYLGAMAHYIGDVSQYGHSYPNEHHHGDYERRVRNQTDQFDDGVFESYLVVDSFVRRRPFTAVKRISRATSGGRGQILPAEEMDALYAAPSQRYTDSIGASLNLAVNELADVLHTFFLNVVDAD